MAGSCRGALPPVGLWWALAAADPVCGLGTDTGKVGCVWLWKKHLFHIYFQSFRRNWCYDKYIYYSVVNTLKQKCPGALPSTRLLVGDDSCISSRSVNFLSECVLAGAELGGWYLGNDTGLGGMSEVTEPTAPQ